MAEHFIENYEYLKLKYNFEIDSLIANPNAIKIHKRYKDRDLNRCFYKDDLYYKYKHDISND